MKRVDRRRRSAERGQAAVETAIVMPLVIFMVLGTLQLFMAQHGRILAQLAAYKAVRAGTVRNASCKAMTHAAIATLLPSFARVLKEPGNNPMERMTSAFALRRTNAYLERDVKVGGGSASIPEEPIVWVAARTNRPFNALGTGDDEGFDDLNLGTGGYVLSVRLTYWYPLTIPFANAVLFRLMVAHQSQGTQDLLFTFRKDNLRDRFVANTALEDEMRRRRDRDHYTMPIVVTSAMRMMTPPRSTANGGISGSIFSTCSFPLSTD